MNNYSHLEEGKSSYSKSYLLYSHLRGLLYHNIHWHHSIYPQFLILFLKGLRPGYHSPILIVYIDFVQKIVRWLIIL